MSHNSLLSHNSNSSSPERDGHLNDARGDCSLFQKPNVPTTLVPTKNSKQPYTDNPIEPKCSEYSLFQQPYFPAILSYNNHTFRHSYVSTFLCSGYHTDSGSPMFRQPYVPTAFCFNSPISCYPLHVVTMFRQLHNPTTLLSVNPKSSWL